MANASRRETTNTYNFLGITVAVVVMVVVVVNDLREYYIYTHRYAEHLYGDDNLLNMQIN